jgi:hypothetical protein
MLKNVKLFPLFLKGFFKHLLNIVKTENLTNFNIKGTVLLLSLPCLPKGKSSLLGFS